MRRKPRPLDAPAVSLFPFLAVLLCTMGALIVLLVFFVGQAQRAENAEAAPDPKVEEPAPPVPDTSREQEERQRAHREALAKKAQFEEAIRELSARREEGARLLAAVREELSRDEEQSGHLRGKVDELEAVERQLEKLAAGSARDRLAAQADALRKRIEDQKLEVERTRKAASKQAPSYAIVPYTGPNQTRRRPIYIECRADTIILQPEGVVLEDADFRGPLGPSNPLAATVRAISDHIRRHSQATGEASVPYPLMVVRPDGILTYYVAREALAALGTDFGYELIEKDWNIEFQKPNPEVKQLADRTLESARQRQREMIAAAPRLYGKMARGRVQSLTQQLAEAEAKGKGEVPGEGSGAGGGLGTGTQGSSIRVRESDPRGLIVEGSGLPGSKGVATAGRVLGSPTPGSGPNGLSPDGSGRPSTGALAQGNSPGPGGNGLGGGPALGAPGGGEGDPASKGSGEGRGDLYPGFASKGGAGGSKGNGQGTGGQGTGGLGNGLSPSDLVVGPSTLGTPKQGNAGGSTGNGTGGGSPEIGLGNENGSGSEGGGTGSGSTATGASPAPRRPGELAPRPSLRGGTSAARGARSGSGNAGGPSGSAAGGSASGGSAAGGSSAGSNASSGGPSGGGGSGGNAPGSAGGGFTAGAQPSFAARRGEGWASQKSVYSSIAVQRLIIVECYDDRLVVLPERKVIPLDTRTADVIDQLVQVVHEHTNSWGVAGENCYWRPELVCRVAPNGALRYSELRDLLEGSGIEVRQATRR